MSWGRNMRGLFARRTLAAAKEVDIRIARAQRAGLVTPAEARVEAMAKPQQRVDLEARVDKAEADLEELRQAVRLQRKLEAEQVALWDNGQGVSEAAYAAWRAAVRKVRELVGPEDPGT